MLTFFFLIRSCPKIVERLIHAGVQLNVKTTAGETALDMAIANNLRDCARLLITNGCDVNIQVCILHLPKNYYQ